MWLIFLLAVAVIFAVGMSGVWIANKVFISMKRDNHKFDLEVKKDSEYINTKGDIENVQQK